MQSRSPRFEIQKPVEYTVKTPSGKVEGHGRTLNISRRGVLFETHEEQVAVGRKIELVVQMGDAVGTGAPIHLKLQGVIIRTDNGSVAVSIKKYQLQSDGEPVLANEAKQTS